MEFLFNPNILFYLAGYFIGAIPFGLILAKRFGGVDIRSSGSGSIGATNVLRVIKEKDPALAKKLGIATLALDASKGAVVMLVAKAMGFDESVMWTIAVLAVIGHCFSPYLKFEGGKGVATGVGVTMVLLPIEAIIGLASWYLVGKKIKISSIASLSGMMAAVIASFIVHPTIPVIESHAPIVIIGFIIFYKHIPNIIRLFKKEESAVV